jgi:hypothetical protein
MCLKLVLSQEKEIKRALYILCHASLLFLLLVMSFFCPCYSSMSIVNNCLPWCLVEVYLWKYPCSTLIQDLTLAMLWVILILEVFISENYEKTLAMKVSDFFLQVERQVYPIQGLNYIYILHHKCCLAWWIGLGLCLLGRSNFKQWSCPWCYIFYC